MTKVGFLKEWMIERGAEIQFPKYGFWFIKLYWELGDIPYSIELAITTNDWDITVHRADSCYFQYKVFHVRDIHNFIANLEDKVPLKILLGSGNCIVNKYNLDGDKIAEVGGHWDGPKNLYRGKSGYYGLKEFLDVKERSGDKPSPSKKKSGKTKKS